MSLTAFAFARVLQLFCADEREVIKRDNPEAGFGDIAKLLAAAWQGISANDKQAYSDRHEVCYATAGMLLCML